jgi:hypothetical protein
MLIMIPFTLSGDSSLSANPQVTRIAATSLFGMEIA